MNFLSTTHFILPLEQDFSIFGYQQTVHIMEIMVLHSMEFWFQLYQSCPNRFLGLPKDKSLVNITSFWSFDDA